MTGASLRSRAFLLRELVIRDWRSRYASSALGFLWAYVQPATQLVLFTFVFGRVFGLRGEPHAPGGFAVFLFAGLLPWLGLSEGLQRSATALQEGSVLVRKHVFPPELLVASTVLSAFLQQLTAAIVFLAFLAFRGEIAWGRLWVFPALAAVQLLLTFGLGLGLAVGQVLLRDVSQAVSVALMCWFYSSPIVYPAEFAPAWFAAWMPMNPLATLAQSYRWVFLGGAAPMIRAVVFLLTFGLLATVAGWWLFRRVRPTLADEL